MPPELGTFYPKLSLISAIEPIIVCNNDGNKTILPSVDIYAQEAVISSKLQY